MRPPEPRSIPQALSWGIVRTTYRFAVVAVLIGVPELARGLAS